LVVHRAVHVDGDDLPPAAILSIATVNLWNRVNLATQQVAGGTGADRHPAIPGGAASTSSPTYAQPNRNGQERNRHGSRQDHCYTIDPADLDELIARRATLITAIRAAHPGLAEARLTRLEDGTFTDVWRWDSAEQLQAALAAMPIPEARAAMSLTRDATAVDGEIIDER
jgi:hypothetical protein